MRRPFVFLLCSLAVTIIAACGSSHKTPTQPTGGNDGSTGGPTTPPSNDLPTIQSITVQGMQPNEPADFADLGESVPVAAVVQDADTPPDQLVYQWDATAGTFAGTGANV